MWLLEILLILTKHQTTNRLYLLFPDEEPVTPIEELDAGITYIFDTEEAYIKTSVPINILERKLTSIKFIIPFGTTELEIETKQAGEIVTESYKVK